MSSPLPRCTTASRYVHYTLRHKHTQTDTDAQRPPDSFASSSSRSCLGPNASDWTNRLGRCSSSDSPPASRWKCFHGRNFQGGGTRADDRCCDCTQTGRPAAHTLLRRYFLTNTHTDADPWAGPIRQGFLSALRATLDTFTVSLPRPLPALTHTLMFFHLHQVLFLPLCQNCAQPLFFQSAYSQAWKGCRPLEV